MKHVLILINNNRTCTMCCLVCHTFPPPLFEDGCCSTKSDKGFIFCAAIRRKQSHYFMKISRINIRIDCP